MKLNSKQWEQKGLRDLNLIILVSGKQYNIGYEFGQDLNLCQEL